MTTFQISVPRGLPRMSLLTVSILWLLTLTGCTSIRLISDYDAVTDSQLVALQEKTDALVESLNRSFGTDSASFQQSSGLYDDIDRDLRRLEFRIGAIPNNAKTESLVRNIRLAIIGAGGNADSTSLRDLHSLPENRDRGIPLKTLEVARRNINQTIFAALRLELAKKQGRLDDQ